MKTNLAKFAAIGVEKGQKEGFLRSKRSKITPGKEKERENSKSKEKERRRKEKK